MAAKYPPNLVFAQRIVTRRKARGWSQETLADRTSIPVSRLSAYENDQREITVVDLLKIADAIEVELNELIGKGLLL